MDYELYHDESRKKGYWHGMLLVPVNAKGYLLNLLEKARRVTKYQHYITLKNIRGPGTNFECQRIWIQIASLSLRSRLGIEPEFVYWGKTVPMDERYERVNKKVGVKFIVFREIDQLSKMSQCLDFGGKVETSFRMGFKGGLHYLGSEADPIHITKIHFDGYMHYHRHLDRTRLIDKLYGLRPYISISSSSNLIDDRSSKYTEAVSQPYDDCELIQLTDLILGCFITSLIGNDNVYKTRVAYPIKQLVFRLMEGYKRMSNSRWANSICMSQCYLESDHWNFETIEIEKNDSISQLQLPY